MSKSENILQLYAKSPAPCRDYYGLTVNSDNVILNIWNISHGPHVYPKRHKVPLNEFSVDLNKNLQTEIRRLFGEHVLVYILKLAKGELNLQYLPCKIFRFILKHLASNDILRLSQTSKIFFELCNTNNVWEILYRKTKGRPTVKDLLLVERSSWKEILQSKFVKKGKECVKKLVKNKTMNSKDVKSPSHSTKMKLEKASKHAQSLIKSCNTNLNEISKMQLNVKEIRKPVSDEYGDYARHCKVLKEGYKAPSKEEHEAKLETLRKLGIMPDNPRYLQARSKAEAIHYPTPVPSKLVHGISKGVPKNPTQQKALKPILKSQQKKPNTEAKLEATTQVDLLRSFNRNESKKDEKKFQAKSAANFFQNSKEKEKIPPGGRAAEFFKHMEGSNVDSLNMERLRVLKEIEAKVQGVRGTNLNNINTNKKAVVSKIEHQNLNIDKLISEKLIAKRTNPKLLANI